jgi:hypothetical protein
VSLGEPATFTVEFVKKFVPVTTRVKVGEPAITLLGVNEVIVGAAALIVNVTGAPLTPPPGPGFETSTLTPPSKFTNDTGTVAVRLVEVPELAAIKLPLKTSEAPVVNPEPEAVIVTGV